MEVIQVTPETLAEYLPDLPEEILRIPELAHKADMIRSRLVQRYGGMWLDSDALVLKDLNWLFDYLADYDFVAFNDGGALTSSRPWVRVNCFLSNPNGTVVSEWVEQQASKFPRLQYDWQEVGTDALHPICLAHAPRVRVLPFALICPIPWNHVARFLSRWHQPTAEEMAETSVVMLSNKAVSDRASRLQRMTIEQIRRDSIYLSHWVRRAYDSEYRPPRGLARCWAAASSLASPT